MFSLVFFRAIALAAAAPVLIALPTGERTPTVAGTYVVRSVNGHALPVADRLPSAPGYEHRATLTRAAVRLDADGRFVLTAHYAHEHTARNAPPSRVPARDDAVRGRWTLEGSTLTLVPARSKRGRQAAPLVGRLAGGRLVLPHDVSIGVSERHYVFAAVYDPAYF